MANSASTAGQETTTQGIESQTPATGQKVWPAIWRFIRAPFQFIFAVAGLLGGGGMLIVAAVIAVIAVLVAAFLFLGGTVGIILGLIAGILGLICLLVIVLIVGIGAAFILVATAISFMYTIDVMFKTSLVSESKAKVKAKFKKVMG